MSGSSTGRISAIETKSVSAGTERGDTSCRRESERGPGSIEHRGRKFEARGERWEDVA
jgi:hypothetical protein